MTVDHADTEAAHAPPATVHVTLDQLVAMNMRHWRRSAGMTQEELGERLGWSARNVSAAERSADDKRDKRRFDAETLGALSLALGVPLIALFLPPEDDSPEKRYVFSGLPGDPLGDIEQNMADLLALVLMPDLGDRTPVRAAYGRRFTSAVATYLDSEWAAAVARWLAGTLGDEIRELHAERLAAERAGLLRLAEHLGDMIGIIKPGSDDDG